MAGTTGTAKPKMGRGLTLTLQILAVINAAAALGILSAAFSLGWPARQTFHFDEGTTAIMALLIMAQIPVRIGAWAVIARWSWRLTANAQKQTRFPVSPLWAWLGWFVPGACFFFPASTLMALNSGRGIAPWRRITILAWWITRVATCCSGSFLTIIAVGIYLEMTKTETTTIAGGNYFGATFCSWLGITGLVAHILEIFVVTMTYRHQPKAGDITAADHF